MQNNTEEPYDFQTFTCVESLSLNDVLALIALSQAK